MLLKIYAVMEDAEEKQMTNRLVKMWLDELKDLAYDVEDILDEFATEALQRNLMAIPQPSTSKVWSFIPSCCTSFSASAVKFNFRMGSKIETITARLQDISTQKSDLVLRENAGGNESTDNEVCIISVVGMGGLGKTNLAQLAYNDEKVKDHFDLRVWVCVSDDIEVLRIAKIILQFLLILDNVWSERSDKWDSLCYPLGAGVSGSKIIVTTRNMGVVSAITGTCSSYTLAELSFDDCLSLFTQQALRRRNYDNHPNLKAIGEEIVKKCKGLPLAAKTLGGLLRTKIDLDAWREISRINIRDAMDANLKHKHNIEELIMEWSNNFGDSRIEWNEMPVLELLQPHGNLKKLTVAFYGGTNFPSWMGDPSFSTMVSLTLKDCRMCTSLPSLRQLSSLKELCIEGMSEIKTIGAEFYGKVSLSVKPFLSLVSLIFGDMTEWEEWCFSNVVEEVELFSHLQELTLRNCPKLIKKLPDCLPSLLKLNIFKCPKLADPLERFPCLGHLHLTEMPFLAALENLVIRDCDELTSLWENGLGAESLCHLQHLKIQGCPALVSLEE
ncbi:putative disease resistance protein RGA3 [Vitis vinifera]|uniref:Putative disease resistance protein RGA3 n=1 Tax=Vitis vinifera TaxID=29760 RepID=A0A438GG94_VITVI|nr:putative disease resistance protein RGA3 [Vitis vinifera]